MKYYLLTILCFLPALFLPNPFWVAPYVVGVILVLNKLVQAILDS